MTDGSCSQRGLRLSGSVHEEAHLNSLDLNTSVFDVSPLSIQCIPTIYHFVRKNTWYYRFGHLARVSACTIIYIYLL